MKKLKLYSRKTMTELMQTLPDPEHVVADGAVYHYSSDTKPLPPKELMIDLWAFMGKNKDKPLSLTIRNYWFDSETKSDTIEVECEYYKKMTGGEDEIIYEDMLANESTFQKTKQGALMRFVFDTGNGELCMCMFIADTTMPVTLSTNDGQTFSTLNYDDNNAENVADKITRET